MNYSSGIFPTVTHSQAFPEVNYCGNTLLKVRACRICKDNACDIIPSGGLAHSKHPNT